MKRSCPVCHIPLKELKVKRRLKIDVCQACRGIWFDKNELTQAYEHGRFPEQLMSLPNLTRDQIICDSCGNYNPRSKKTCASCGASLAFPCPVCRKDMQEVQIGNVAIDRCLTCQGIWLDGGELELLFSEFAQRKREEIERVRRDGGELSGNLAAWAALETLDTLIWSPGLLYHAGDAVADVVTGLPGAITDGAGAIVDGAGAVLEGIGDLPEVAGDIFEGTAELASGAADIAGNVLEGAAELAGDLPEIAGSIAEAGASFIEIIFEIIASIFDN